MPTQTTVVSSAAIEYFEALVANGLFVTDASGAGSINTPVSQLVSALHEVLAGGRVTITVTSPGTPSIMSTLDSKLTDAVASLNSTAPTGGTIFTP